MHTTNKVFLRFPADIGIREQEIISNGGNVDEERGRVLLSGDVCVDISRM